MRAEGGWVQASLYELPAAVFQLDRTGLDWGTPKVPFWLFCKRNGKVILLFILLLYTKKRNKREQKCMFLLSFRFFGLEVVELVRNAGFP